MYTNKNYFTIYGLLVLGALGLLIWGCDTGVETSPDPGVLRIVLQSEPSDTSIIIVADTLSVAPNDSFGVTIFQGKAFEDSTYAILYRTLKSTAQEDNIYNIIRIENGEYKQFTIFESYVPPGDYDKIQFGMNSNILKFSGFDEIKVETLDESKFVDLYHDFEVSANRTTEISIQISPFKSISRYKDSYRFSPQVQITNVVNL